MKKFLIGKLLYITKSQILQVYAQDNAKFHVTAWTLTQAEIASEDCSCVIFLQTSRMATFGTTTDVSLNWRDVKCPLRRRWKENQISMLQTFSPKFLRSSFLFSHLLNLKVLFNSIEWLEDQYLVDLRDYIFSFVLSFPNEFLSFISLPKIQFSSQTKTDFSLSRQSVEELIRWSHWSLKKITRF